MTRILDLLANACFLAAAGLSLISAIGMWRFPDLLTRMHAAAKPQVVGLGLALLGLAVRIREPLPIVLLSVIALFQAVTTPIASHMVGRASFRAGQVQTDNLVTDELSPTYGDDEPRGAP